MKKEKKLCWETNLPGVCLVLYREDNTEISFRKGQNLKGLNFRFTFEGRDEKAIILKEVRSRGRLVGIRDKLAVMLCEAFGVGIATFTDSGDNFQSGIFVCGEFLRKDFPDFWFRVDPFGR